jgi:uncharacterized protein (DUF58 family)
VEAEGLRAWLFVMSRSKEKAPSRMTPHRLALGGRARATKRAAPNGLANNHLPPFPLTSRLRPSHRREYFISTNNSSFRTTTCHLLRARRRVPTPPEIAALALCDPFNVNSTSTSTSTSTLWPARRYGHQAKARRIGARRGRPCRPLG